MDSPNEHPAEEGGEDLASLQLRVKRLEESLSRVRRLEVSAEAALRFAEGILEAAREPLLVLSGDLRVSSANRAFYECFRVKREETLGRFVYALGNGQWDGSRLRLLLKDVIPANLQIENFEIHHGFPTIGRRVMLLNARKFERDSFGTLSILLAIEDVTDRKRFEEELMEAAVTDPLTGLQNRRGMASQVEKLIARSRGAGKGFDLLFADVDHLKTINDQLGHAEGDRAIIDVSLILRANFRQSDIVARVGGDEFVVAPAGAQGDDREAILVRLRSAVATYNLANPRPFKLSVSAGIAGYDPASDRPLDEIFAAGDAALYEQKHRRKEG